ncbi:MAG: hypothetical protein AAGA20_23655, partial [Planctomycetota bacterium]
MPSVPLSAAELVRQRLEVVEDALGRLDGACDGVRRLGVVQEATERALARVQGRDDLFDPGDRLADRPAVLFHEIAERSEDVGRRARLQRTGGVDLTGAARARVDAELDAAEDGGRLDPNDVVSVEHDRLVERDVDADALLARPVQVRRDGLDLAPADTGVEHRGSLAETARVLRERDDPLSLFEQADVRLEERVVGEDAEGGQEQQPEGDVAAGGHDVAPGEALRASGPRNSTRRGRVGRRNSS